MRKDRWVACRECRLILGAAEARAGECPGCGRPFTAAGEVLGTRAMRFAGYCLDQAVTGLLMPPALYVAGILEATGKRGPEVFLSAMGWTGVISAAYFIVPTALWGQTLGKWFAGLQVVGPDGDAPGWKRALLRGVAATIAGLLFNVCIVGILDPLWLLWDPCRQTLHDKVAGTVVVTTRRRRPALTVTASLLLAVGAQVGLVFACVRPFIIQAYYVPSMSMDPTLAVHDRVLANKLSCRYGELRRGDIIVFRAPRNALAANPVANPDLSEKKDFIKRVVALPGDTVQVEDGRLWLKTTGEAELHTVEEPYLRGTRMERNWGPVTVPAGSVVVFGDNRNNSNDSTHWGEPVRDARGHETMRPAPFLPIANIHGRAIYRYWPPSRWGELPRVGK